MKDPPRKLPKSAVALLLTFTAGVVDIVGYLTLYHLFTAHMTGNTVHLGSALAAGEWSEAAKSGAIIASFVAASIVGRAVIEAGARNGVRRVASVGFAAEALLIASFLWMLGPMSANAPPLPLAALCALLALLAAAMGLQTATLTRIGPLTVHTTFVTGMLNKLAQMLSHWLFWAYDECSRGSGIGDVLRRSPGQPAFANASFMLTIWICYMVGAVAGTWMQFRWTTRSLYVAIAALVVAVAVDQYRPLSLEEEADQAKL